MDDFYDWRPMSPWRQWRALGLPRCQRCNRLILPWQEWVNQVDEHPEHHTCHHRYLVGTRRYVLDDNADRGRDSADFFACDFCHWETVV